MSGVKLHIRLAETRADILRCRHLIAGIYNRAYQVVFSETEYNLEAKIEPWPHRYVMGLIGQDLVCAAGLYLRDTYVERFGQVEPAEFQRVIDDAGDAASQYDWSRKREYTKLVVREDMRGKGLAAFFLAATQSRYFMQVDLPESAPAVLVVCGKQSIWRNIWEPAGIRMRLIKPFPIYRVHENYASPEDPMDSRMVIPELDIPERFYDLQLPGTYEVTPVRAEARSA